MEITISERNHKWLKKMIESGMFASVDEVLDQARELFDDTHEYMADLRAKVQEGLEALERGDYVTYTDENLRELAEDIKRKGRERLKARNRNTAD